MQQCQLNVPPPGSTVRPASETLKQSLSLSGDGGGVLGFFLHSGIRDQCLSVFHLHRSPTVGKPDTRMQRAPHSFVVYDGVR